MISYSDLSPHLSASFYNKNFVIANTNLVGDVCAIIKNKVWSPCIFRQGIRQQDHFLYADWCVLDFDDGEMTLRDAENTFCDMVHIIGTTKSHRVAKNGVTVDRFRVCLKFETRITKLRDYRFAMKTMIARYPADKACKDGARFFYPCKEITSLSEDGFTVDDIPAVTEDFETTSLAKFEELQAYKRARILPRWIKTALEREIPPGQRNTMCYRLAINLTLYGMQPSEIEARLIASPTFNGDHNRFQEVNGHAAIWNGVKRGLHELKSFLLEQKRNERRG